MESLRTIIPPSVITVAPCHSVSSAYSALVALTVCQDDDLMKFLADMQDKRSLVKKLRRFSVGLQVAVNQLQPDQKVPKCLTPVCLHLSHCARRTGVGVYWWMHSILMDGKGLFPFGFSLVLREERPYNAHVTSSATWSRLPFSSSRTCILFM